MTIEIGIEKYTPNHDHEAEFTRFPVGQTVIEVDGQAFPHLVTSDFPPTDPWSKIMRRVIAQVRDRGEFRRQPLIEFGIGDGRNIREAGPEISEVTGVEIEKWRLQVAGVNLVTGPARLTVPVELWRADAVEFLQNLKTATGRDKLSGWVVICLPQSPEGLNTADAYDGSVTLNTFRHRWDRYGLTLNAATLDSLRQVADRDLRALVILSDRVTAAAKIQMIQQTGWQIEKQYQTPQPIQQDPDTGISWVARIDDGARFFELAASGYNTISAIEAERRRLASYRSGRGRDDLNVYHHLTVYQLGRR